MSAERDPEARRRYAAQNPEAVKVAKDFVDGFCAGDSVGDPGRGEVGVNKLAEALKNAPAAGAKPEAVAPPRPAKPPAPKIDLVPDELKARWQWVVWKYELRGEKWTKIPYQPHRPRSKAKAGDSSTWSEFTVAWRVYLAGGFDGIGYEFAADDPYFGVDIDDCLKDGEVLRWAHIYVEWLQSGYGEISPSGNGLKFIAKGKLPSDRGGCRRGLGPDASGEVGVYDHGRFFVTTGDVFGNSTTIGELPEAVVKLYDVVAPEGKPEKKTKSGGNGQYVPRNGSAGFTPSDQDVFDAIGRSAMASRIRSLWGGSWQGVYASQSQADGALCNYLAFYCGKDNEAQVERLFLQSKLGQRSKVTDRKDYLPRTVDFAYLGRTDFYEWVQPEVKTTEKSIPEGNGQGVRRPSIEVTTERHEVRDETIRALSYDERIYLRGDALATVWRSPESTRKLFGGHILRNANGAPGVSLLDESRLGCLLTENASFFTWHKDRQDEWQSRDCHPPSWLIAAVLSHKEYHEFRPLLSVAECPYIGLDGAVNYRPGYDETTGTVLVPSFTLLPVPDWPSKQDAIDAWGRLNWLVREFPWASGFDSTVWLSALLTGIQRPAIAGCVPGFAFCGNVAGSGKGLAIDAIGYIVWGGPVPVSQYPDDKTEAEKVVLSIAIEGIAAVHFDNLEEGSQYGNGAIDSALTCTAKGGRPLGESRWVKGVALRPCWFLSGNNISPTEDAFRRWLPCNILSKEENPHERQCEVELKAHVAEHRAEIVRDALMILKAHRAAGSPPHGKPPLGSFEEWDRMIRAAVWFATGNDCLHTQRQATTGSPERVKKMALMEAWKNLPDQDRGITAAEAVKMAKERVLVEVRDSNGKLTIDKNAPFVYPELNSALLELGWKGEIVDSNRLGNLIRAIQNQKLGGSKFEKCESKDRTNKVLWKVV